MKKYKINSAFFFKLVDEDGGGTIDAEELEAGLKRLGVNLTRAERRGLMNYLDQADTLTVPILTLTPCSPS